jgi:hypothetical protein
VLNHTHRSCKRRIRRTVGELIQSETAPAGSPDRQKLRLQYEAHFQAMLDAAGAEIGASSKQASLSRMRCAYDSTNRDDPSATNHALECWLKVIDKGNANADTYYEIASLKARKQDFNGAIEALNHCADLDGARTTSKSFIETDPDFQDMLRSDLFRKEFERVLARFASKSDN